MVTEWYLSLAENCLAVGKLPLVDQGLEVGYESQMIGLIWDLYQRIC